ncbi:MAG: ketoacyl-ACP synthase III [Candidatus Marinimicrobia bacterium]|nr:ketoacyl-ACP synthase III [Candidatus Neomarinimicrobiota bacterium]
MNNAIISGTGFHLPENVVTNFDLEKLMDTTDEWIQERTGIIERRYVKDGVGPAGLAIPATEMALKDAGLTVSDIELIIFATSTPDYYAPGSACILQHEMGFKNIGALDIRVQCSGFVYGLSIAHQYIKTGMYKHILLIGAEVQSTAMDLTNRGRDTAIIFGDGAGAVVVSATDEDRGILSTHLHSDGAFLKELWCELPSSKMRPRISQEMMDEGRHFLFMNGKEVFRNAVTKFPEVIMEGLSANGLTPEDVNLLIPHQANTRITEMVRRRMKLSEEAVYSNIHKYGNTTAASIPIALAEAMREDLINPNDIIVFASFGSGFTWASAIIKW